MLVVIEGLDGAGKSSVCESLAKSLKNEASFHRTPGGGIKEIRNIVLDPDRHLSYYTKMFLFLAEMIQVSVDLRLFGRSNKDSLVIFDRFYPSTFVYQVLCNLDDISGEDYDKILSLFFGFMPKVNLTVILMVKPEVGRERSAKKLEFGKADAFESSNMAVWEERRVCYQTLPQCAIGGMLGEVLEIDTTNKTIEDVTTIILNKIRKMREKS